MSSNTRAPTSDDQIQPSGLSLGAFSRLPSGLLAFGSLIKAKIALLGPGSRSLAKAEALAAREIFWAIKLDTPQEQATALDNAWSAHGPEAFAAAMRRPSWQLQIPLAGTSFKPLAWDEPELALPTHVTLLIRSGEWRAKLLSLAPSDRMRDSASHKIGLSARIFGQDALSKRGLSEVTSPMMLCASANLSSPSEWSDTLSTLRAAGCRPPSGDALIACQEQLDEAKAPDQKNALRAWAEAEQISEATRAAPAAPAGPHRKTRSI